MNIRRIVALAILEAAEDIHVVCDAILNGVVLFCKEGRGGCQTLVSLGSMTICR